MNPRPINILLVEDNDTDVLIARQALKSARVLNELNVVDNGEDALLYILQSPPYEGVLRPDIILLDWNLPRRSGHEVLQVIKTHEELRRIPVVVLTTSDAEETIRQAYDLHANSFVTKPLDINAFQNVLKAIEDFWLYVVTLPNTRHD